MLCLSSAIRPQHPPPCEKEKRFFSPWGLGSQCFLPNSIESTILAAGPHSQIESGWAMRPSAGVLPVLGSECHIYRQYSPHSTCRPLREHKGEQILLSAPFSCFVGFYHWPIASKPGTGGTGAAAGGLESAVMPWEEIYLNSKLKNICFTILAVVGI